MDVLKKSNVETGFSDFSDSAIFELEETCGAHHYERVKLVVRHAIGCWLYDEKGNKYLDCLAAYSAANPGHHHPYLIKAITNALEGKFASVLSNVVYTDPLGVFLSKAAVLVPV